jgi:hypothetical protein
LQKGIFHGPDRTFCWGESQGIAPVLGMRDQLARLFKARFGKPPQIAECIDRLHPALALAHGGMTAGRVLVFQEICIDHIGKCLPDSLRPALLTGHNPRIAPMGLATTQI